MAITFKNTGQGGNIIIKNNGLGGRLQAIESQRPIASGVAFVSPQPYTYTSFRTGDEGWRWQNGWFDYTPPSNPLKVAALDFTSANAKYVLKTPLTVNGISSTQRFVSFRGNQDFTAGGVNGNLLLIDKLTGLGIARSSAFGTWNSTIDSALSYSITVNGIVYSDWYMMGIYEYYTLFANTNYSAGSWVDPITSNIICTFSANPFAFILLAGANGSRWPQNSISPASYPGDNQTTLYITKETRNLIS
jgi:hypothetical protein